MESSGLKQYLTFLIDEYFAINVSYVVEVLEYTNVTKIPRTPAYMAGVINNRGSVVPIINLRAKFGLELVDATQDTCIIILEVTHEDEKLNVGVLVDSVQEVIDLDGDQIEPPPKIGIKLDTEFIQGIGKVDEKFVILLNIEKILTTEELVIIKDSDEKAVLAGQKV